MAIRYRSKISASVHEAMRNMWEIGLIDRRTMRRFDASCVTNKVRKRPTGPKAKAALAQRGQTRRV
jgi:putative transcriptional regulator